MTPQEKNVFGKLFTKTELASQKVDLAKSITEIEKAYEQALTLEKQFNLAKQERDNANKILQRVSDDFQKPYITVVMDGKETLKAITDLGLQGPETNYLKNAISQISGIRTKIGNPSDWK
jgi:hypothetical protein